MCALTGGEFSEKVRKKQHKKKMYKGKEERKSDSIINLNILQILTKKTVKVFQQWNNKHLITTTILW